MWRRLSFLHGLCCFKNEDDDKRDRSLINMMSSGSVGLMMTTMIEVKKEAEQESQNIQAEAVEVRRSSTLSQPLSLGEGLMLAGVRRIAA